ncbi:MAG: disulfide bond formation protein B [Nanohaloarchaea archaeon SW_7_46_7]|nr:MAG: disulfide bond formation protein B [Nanohaloarchaea archaeon SW_7_46_7]
MIVKILAIETLLLNVFLLALGLSYLVKRFTGFEEADKRISEAFDFFTPRFRELAFLLTSVSVLGSLYMSEILEIPACEFCWYQRILIFPLPVILGVSLFMDKDDVADYVISLAALGVPVSVYHYLVQMSQLSTGSCSTAVSCSSVQVQEFGFVTIPWMSLTLFLTVIALALLRYRKQSKAS